MYDDYDLDYTYAPAYEYDLDESYDTWMQSSYANAPVMGPPKPNVRRTRLLMPAASFALGHLRPLSTWMLLNRA